MIRWLRRMLRRGLRVESALRAQLDHRVTRLEERADRLEAIRRAEAIRRERDLRSRV